MDLRRDVFQAIADPTRRAIIALVALNAMTPLPLPENSILRDKPSPTHTNPY
jgi:hypothetical protein